MIETSQDVIKTNKKKVTDLEYQIKNAKQLREKRIAQLEKVHACVAIYLQVPDLCL